MLDPNKCYLESLKEMIVSHGVGFPKQNDILVSSISQKSEQTQKERI